MIIDFHVHPWTKDFMLSNQPIVKACEFFHMPPSEFPDSIETLVDQMDVAGVGKAVILGQDTHQSKNIHFKNYTIKNDLLYKLARKHGERFAPFAGVDPNGGVDAVKELKRCVVELGFKGLKIHSSANSVYPNDQKRMYLIYEFCQERELPILFHTGTTGLGYCDVKYSKPEYLDEVAQDFPDLKIVMAHFGWPWSDVAIALALRNPNLYLDVSGWKPKYLPANLLQYLKGPLRTKFLFGTDYPMIKQVDWFKSFEQDLRPRLGESIAEGLLGRNAEGLLRD